MKFTFKEADLREDNKDLTPEYRKYIASKKWKRLRERVIAKRGRKCQRCKSTTRPLQLHHKHYNTFGHERTKDVLLLCVDCHLIEDRLRRKKTYENANVGI